MQTIPDSWNVRTFLTTLISGIMLLAAWETLRLTVNGSASLMPPAVDILRRLLSAVQQRAFWIDAFATGLRAITGLVVATALAIPTGIFLWEFSPLRQSTAILTDFLRSIPVTTLYPAFVLLLGVGNAAKVGMIFTACFFVVLLNVFYGLIQRNPLRHKLLLMLGVTRRHLLRRIVFWEVLPQALVGVRTAASLSLVVAVLVEMFMGAGHGLGQDVMQAYAVYDMSTMFAYVLATGFMGFAFNRVLQSVERQLVGWANR